MHFNKCYKHLRIPLLLIAIMYIEAGSNTTYLNTT